jgi:hypothetical protein
MANFLKISNGVPRSAAETANMPIYDETLELVSSSPISGQILGPILTGAAVTLPNSGFYTGDELEVYLNGKRLYDVYDYNYYSSTQTSFTFDLIVGDVIRFRKDRPA